VLCKGTSLRMRLTIGERRCFNVKFYVGALVGVMIKVILQNARCNNKVIQHIRSPDQNLNLETQVHEL